ncbi:hypothetical protein M422DRAFT_780191 [Sphaerobolus stellatus SS14]|uniref:Uncharacterized protein n=1 Tax=Sphaerobolus stellatus (strain SS14) TaxID=990650 RepID=A0A0C9VTZ1_SPHS4|nr:hypothetical protein M422DRAFT_780191 [Sphaerobolus stellatus SS14]
MPASWKFPLLRLPTDIIHHILENLWESVLNKKELITMMTSMPLICKELAVIYACVSQVHVRIPNRKFYENRIKKISDLPRAHTMNTRCRSLRFYVDQDDVSRERVYQRNLPATTNGVKHSDGLAYYSDGRRLSQEGVFPNLRAVYVNYDNAGVHDPYHTLFPHFMPKTVEYLHINYTFTPFPSRIQSSFGPMVQYAPRNIRRRTPIRYPSIPHPLRKLTICGLDDRVDVARLWETLFDIEVLTVDGKDLPLGRDPAWKIEIAQACEMLERDYRGTGWYWNTVIRRPLNPGETPFHPPSIRIIPVETLQPMKGNIGQQAGKSARRKRRRSASFTTTEEHHDRSSSPQVRPLSRSKSCDVLQMHVFSFFYG